MYLIFCPMDRNPTRLHGFPGPPFVVIFVLFWCVANTSTYDIHKYASLLCAESFLIHVVTHITKVTFVLLKRCTDTNI